MAGDGSNTEKKQPEAEKKGTVIAQAGERRAAPAAQTADQVQLAARQSFLDEATHYVLDPVVGMFTSNKERQQQVVDGAKSLAKTVPLFMAGPVGKILLGAAYTSDEVKTSDDSTQMIEDGLLGLGKATGLGLTRYMAAARNVSPSFMGVQLGVVNRGLETGLTRDNYTDDQGNFSLYTGLKKTALTTFNPVSLVSDAALFMAGDILWGGGIIASRGALAYNPTITHALSGGLFGTTSGLGTEISRQLTTGQFDLGKLAWATGSQGAIGLIGGGLGGLQTSRRLSIGHPDTPQEIAAAQSTPFQKGESVDGAQRNLRDGKFIVEKENFGAHNVKFLWGKVQNESGKETPAIFRVDNGSKAFQDRMRAEIGGYGLDQRLGIDGGMPVTVARTLEHNGETFTGFIQELRGMTIKDYFSGGYVENNMTRDAARSLFTNYPELGSSYQRVLVNRQLGQQWDNHAGNIVIDPRARNPAKSMSSIDRDSLRAARTTLDFKPLPLSRWDPDNTGIYLYDEVAGKPIPEDTRNALQTFGTKYNNDSGRAELRSLGYTNRELDGIFGRSQWFVENGILPRAMGTPAFYALWPYLKPIKRYIFNDQRD
jgi:hypothetical protein